jgi:hypothetical protein
LPTLATFLQTILFIFLQVYLINKGMVTTHPRQSIGTRNYDVSLGHGETALLSSIVGENTNNTEISQNAEASSSAINTTCTKVRQTISFEQRIEDLKLFKEKHGHCDLRQFSKNFKSLSIWCNNIRSTYNGNGTMKLTDDRIRRLEEIGFQWTTRAPRAKDKMDITTVTIAVADTELAMNNGAESESASDWSHDSNPDIDDTKRETRSTIQNNKYMTVLEKRQDEISTTAQHHANESKRKSVTEKAVGKSAKHQWQIEASGQSDQRKVPNLPGSPAFDPSRYTIEELQDAVEESKRVCSEMRRREVARLDEMADRLFQTDDEDSS